MVEGIRSMKRLIAMTLAMTSSSALALVDMKNANYSNSWTDLEVAGSGYDMKVVRTYNSRSLFNGMFGFGWCSDFETTLEVTPEGHLKIRECGAGVGITYAPGDLTKADVDKTISQIITKMKSEKKVGQSEAFYKTLQTELVEDEAKRFRLAREHGVSVPVKEGTKYMANGKEVEHMLFQKTHYTRNMADGSAQRFSPDGKLIAMYDKNGNFLKFNYERDVIREIVDNNARKLSFKYYPNKKVQKITGPGGLMSEYRFENLDDLAMVKNAWSNVYTYKYDDLHNLVRATWPDKTAIEIKYDKKNDWVISFKDRDNCNETYNYEFSKENPRNHYWSTVKKVCGKETVADNRYEFWYRDRSDGQSYLHRVLTAINGNSTDISYHETFNKPTVIVRNGERISYDYFPDGLVKAKASANSRMNFQYHAKNKKVADVQIQFFNEKGELVSKKGTQFQYDDKGNLTTAVNSDGQKIAMTYDNRGRIASITDQAKKKVMIQYEDRFGKPSIVTRPGLGAIKVSYKPNGEIQNVESKQGPSVAMQVASTFNNLLDIIAPATAELYL